MKVRIGFGLGARATVNTGEPFGALVDELERHRFDSLWLSERIGADAPDPVVGMAYAAGRTTRLKLGMSVMVLPGRNPLLVAKALASLDRLSDGRLLPAFGLGVVDAREQQAFGVAREERAPLFDEMLPLVRRLWSEESVDHAGPAFTLENASVRPRPLQQPLDVWLGGIAPSEIRRTGRLGDGWLPSFCDVDDVAAGIPAVGEAADTVGRSIDPEHFGALVAYSRGPLPQLARDLLARRRPDKDPTAIIPEGLGALRATLEGMIEVGASKFVVLPIADPEDWAREIDELADAVLDLQT